MKTLLTAFVVTLTIQTATGQHILLEEDVNADTIPESSGPNLKNFWHSFLGYGFVLGDSEGQGAEVEAGSSSEFKAGFRYKRKISNVFSTGFDLGYTTTTFHLKQDSAKILPNNLLHEKEKLVYNNITGVLFWRTNFGKRGNYLGNYLDVAGYGEWAFLVKHRYKDEHDIANGAGASQTQTINTGLLFVEPLNYGVIARIGLNKISFYGKYRLSDLFKKQYIFPELPRITAGLEIAISG